MDRGIEAALAVVIGGGAALGGLWYLDKKTNLFKGSGNGGGTITLPGGSVPGGTSSGGNPGGSSSGTPGGSSSGSPPSSQPTTVSGCQAQGIIVRYGDSGNCVQAVQKTINQFVQYTCPQANVTRAGTVDGQFGAQTLAAVKSFQSSQGITVDGVVGPQTWQALSNPRCTSRLGGSTTSSPGFSLSGSGYQIFDAQGNPVVFQPCTGTYQQGNSGPCVAVLQVMLNVVDRANLTVDGQYGPRTQAAVGQFQLGNNLYANGIANPSTTAALGKAFAHATQSTTPTTWLQNLANWWASLPGTSLSSQLPYFPFY